MSDAPPPPPGSTPAPSAAAASAGADKSTHGHAHPHAQAHASGATGAATETRVAAAKTNLKYLALGAKSGVKPNGVATRGLLTTARYILRYIIHRMFRVAKYAIIGAGIAAIGTGVLGAVGTGVAWFMVPSTGMGLTVGLLWGLAKFGWRHRPDRFRGGWWSEMEKRASEGRDAATDEESDAEIAEAAENERQRRLDRLGGGDIWV